MNGPSRAESIRSLEHQVGVLIRRIKRVIGERAAAVDASLQPSAYLILAYLVEHGAVRASAMVELFTIDKGAVSRQISHLEELGLVVRRPDPDDGRATLLDATDEAVTRMQAVAANRREWMDERLGDWSDERLATFASELSTYNTALNRPPD